MRKLQYLRGSPFARSTKIVLEEKRIEYEEEIFDVPQGVGDASPVSSAFQVPVFFDGIRTIWGTEIIIPYLFDTFPDSPGTDLHRPLARRLTRPMLHWHDTLTITTIGLVADFIVNARLSAEYGDQRFLARQLEQIESYMNWLEARVTVDGFWPGTMSIMDVNLLCPLIYGQEQEVFDYEAGQWKNTEAMVAQLLDRDSVKSIVRNEQ